MVALSSKAGVFSIDLLVVALRGYEVMLERVGYAGQERRENDALAKLHLCPT